MVRMPGQSHPGPLPALDAQEEILAGALERHVRVLAGDIGPRHLERPASLWKAATYLEDGLAVAGYAVERETYEVAGQPVWNLVVELRGTSRPDEILVVGAHYDTVWSTPGADDNASGVAALLEIARALRGLRLARTVRLVAFVNEEPPYFQTERMGSLVHARASAARGDQLIGMLSLEMLGTFLDEEGSQAYPPVFSWFYPDRGDFVAFVGNLDSRALVHRTIEVFRRTTPLPSEGVATFGGLPGIGYSDHWSFWQIGVPAVMVTDTAFFRTAHYHLPSDTPERLDFERMARVTIGLVRVIEHLAGPGAEVSKTAPGDGGAESAGRPPHDRVES
jgi:hypothetical protein